MKTSLTTCLLLLTLGVGCNKSDNGAPAPTAGGAPAATPATATVQPGPGVVTGTITFTGTRPAEMQAPGECCPGVPAPPDEKVVVNPDGTLRNVIVYVDKAPNVGTPVPGEAVLAQVGCRYTPHVFALRVGQKLLVTSHDPTLHNVHIEASANPEQNFGETQGASKAVTFNAPDDDVTFKCDVHQWMRAYAMVFDHPFYAVTGDGGTFRLEHLPPGTYTVKAHHEDLGDLQQTVTVSADKPTVTVKFDFHPPS